MAKKEIKGKFEIELPYKTEAQRKEADKYRKALYSGKTILYEKTKHLVYYFGFCVSDDESSVIVGLVRAP